MVKGWRAMSHDAPFLEPVDLDDVRRYRAAYRALDSAAQVVAMTQLVARAQAPDAASGRVLLSARSSTGAARRIGLLASSMNPLTDAHVAMAQSARHSARLDALYWVANLVTVDKERVARASLVDRLLEGRAYASAVGDGLLLFAGGLYVEQARAAHALLPGAEEIALIVGFDKAPQIFDARYYANRDVALDELFAEAELVVAPRAGKSEADLRALLALPENRRYAGRIHYTPLPALYATDSSTEARELAATGMTEVDAAERERHLRALLTPEGLALTTLTRAYEPSRPATATSLGDAYSARQALLAALADIAPERLASTPPLSRLISLAADPGPAGIALRAWVAGPGAHTLEELEVALARR
jgi:nicotinamide-nucleotide adenylyltransferase